MTITKKKDPKPRRTPTDLEKRIGVVVGRLKEQTGKTLAQIGDGDSAAISKIISGTQGLRMVNVEIIARNLGVPVWQILAEAEGAQPQEVFEDVRAFHAAPPTVKAFFLELSRMLEEGKITNEKLQGLGKFLGMESTLDGWGESKPQKDRRTKQQR